MKKFLLSCFLALGFGANAQISYNANFEDAGSPGYSTTLYGQFGGGTRTAAAACNGTYGGQLAIATTTTQTGYMVILNQITGQTNNGQSVSVTAGYKKAAGVVGSLSLAYMVQDEAGTWSVNLIGTPVSLTTTALASCAQLTGTVPSGALQPGKTNAIGVWFTRTSGSGNIFVDDINFVQQTVTTAPACTTFTTPAGGSTISAGNAVFTWPSVATAVNYKVTIGTTSGGSDVLSTTVSGNTLNASLPTNSTLYARVVPTNSIGDATGCSEISFNTSSTISYCGPITSTAPTAIYPISSVTFNGVTKTSTATAGSLPPYEDFSSTVFNAIVGSSYNLAVTGTGLGTNRFGMTVFVDWNNDGDFNDAGEQYFTSPASSFLGGTGTPINFNGNITVPATASAGNKRMRIKYNFNSSTTALVPSLSDPCAAMGNGQVEDYTITVANPTTAPACTTLTSPANAATNVTPNPTLLTWTAVEGASGYKVYIGTTTGGTDVANGTLVNATTYSPVLVGNTTYYVKIVPTNSLGDAAGCSEISFTTGAAIYCAATATSTTATFERISRVQFANIDNASNTTPASSGVGYEDFTSTPAGNVAQEGSYPITVTIDNFDNDQTAVWIDYNQDGIFSDSEKTVLTSAASATGTVVIPATAKLGTTRMRVRSAYNAAPVACGNTTFGQVEDYTVNITGPTMAVSDVNKSGISIYPNPFTDVLRISDVKGVKSVSVNDMSGRQVKSLAPSAELNLSSLKEGLYIVTLQMEDGSVKTFKAIKK